KRLLQRQVLEIASREQQRVGQELHDVLLQDLTGLALLADAARHGLGAEGGGRELMAKLSGGLEQLNAKVRALCEGLIPVEIAEGGVGFDESQRRDGGLGSRIMQYRCATLGGQLQILQREGGGTIVSCSTSRTQVPAGRGR